MAIFASKVLDEISKELAIREKAVENPIKNKFSFASRIPYIVLESNAVSRDGSSYLAKSNILYGGSPDFINSINKGEKKLFIDTQELGKRPHSGITSISIKNKGTLGSIREATINFSCWSLEELEKLTLLYLNPGIYLNLQWGFTKLDDVAFVNSIFTRTKISQLRKRDIIVELVRNSGGDYDCMVGPCCTFSWKMNQNGGFDCTTTIISPASFVYNFTFNGPGNQDNIFYLWATNAVDTLDELQEKIKNEKDGDALQLKQNQENILLAMKGSLSKVFGDKNLTNMKGAVDMTVPSDANNNEKFFGNGSKYYKYISLPGDSNLKQLGDDLRYISFGHLCTLINSVIFFPETTMDQIKAIENSVKVSNGTPSDNDEFINRGICYLDLDDPNCICRNHKWLRSFKPDEVLIINQSAEQYVSDPSISLTNIMSNYTNKPMVEFDKNKVLFDTDGAGSTLTKPSGLFGFGRIKAIYININSVIRILKESSEIATVIDNILGLINSSVDDIFHLVRFNDENDPLAMKIYDTTLVSNDNKILTFNVYSPNTVVKSITLDGNIPSSFQAAAYVGNTNGNATVRDVRLSSSFSKYSDGFIDGDAYANRKTDTEGTPIVDDVDAKKRQDDWNACIKLQLYDMSAAIYQKTYCIKIKSESRYEPIAFAGFPVGITLNITIDGISGLYVGNLFNINYAPKFLTQNVAFQINDVAHKIDSSGWDTTLTGLFIALRGATNVPISTVTKIKPQPQVIPGTLNVESNSGKQINITQGVLNATGPNID